MLKNRTFFLLIALCAGPPATVAAQNIDSSPAVLAPGDMVRITVWRKPELSGEFEVAPDSSVAHPLYRAVRVAGLPLGAVEERLGTFLRQYETTPNFVVQPLFRVSVGGEVQKPDLYPLRLGTTVIQAIVTAGGATERGRLDQVELVRGGRSQLLDLTRPEAGAAQLTIRSGDQIVVRRRSDVFRDRIAPAASIVAALTAVLSLFVR